MKSKAKKALNKIGLSLTRVDKKKYDYEYLLSQIYHKYHDLTMIPESTYLGNLRLCSRFKSVEGAILECGVWRGGMIGGIAELIGKRKMYYLFDSFEGLPAAKEIDGKTASEWQKDIYNETYYDNCRAEIDYANKAMELANVDCKIIKGWFNDTLPIFKIDEPISILRLDGDWYESTMDCLKHLYPKVNKNGLIILDDYYAWDGCSKAVHDYLSSISSSSKLYTSEDGICYIVKNEQYEQLL